MSGNTALPTALPSKLKQRAELLRCIRRFFDDRGFIEVQTPVLSADTIVDRFVEPLPVEDATLPVTHHGDRRYFLQTSPEFAMKRLLSAGMERIYQIGPVFRKGDRGRFHNVEFTMLEWYRIGENYLGAMDFLAELIHCTAERFGRKPSIAMSGFSDLFQKHTDLDPHRASCRQFKAFADRRGIFYPDSYPLSGVEDRDLWIDLLFAESVQPKLDATIVYDYPGTQSQLAQLRTVNDSESDYVVAERFELFLNGIEIANGYNELLDADELRHRFKKTQRNRIFDGQASLPVESRLLTAMETGLPPCCGTALGIDRLLMVLFNAESIDEVLAFPIERA